MANKSKGHAVEIDGRKVIITNPEKVLYPAARFTKAQVIDYYVRVSDWLLPHLKDRPVTLKRYPDGVGAAHFYEKDAPSFTPDWVRLFPVPRRGGGPDIRYVVIDDLSTLVWSANLANLEIHPFLHKAPRIDRPSFLTFDLDPGEGADLLRCAEVALFLRELFERIGLQAFPKISGSKGIQISLPLNTPVTYAATQPFARAVAQSLAREKPTLVVSEMAKELRKGKVFIDWSQNADFKTTVGVYSLRAKQPHPFVSMPVTWEELGRALHESSAAALSFTPDAALERLQQSGDLYAPVLALKQKLPVGIEWLEIAVERVREYARGRNRANTSDASPPAATRSRRRSGAQAARSGPAKKKSVSEDRAAPAGRTMQESGASAGLPALRDLPRAKIAFIEPMRAKLAAELPEGEEWLYELKLDGYRALALRTAKDVRLLSRNANPLNTRFPAIAAALEALAPDTILDGEIVALDARGRPQFNALQNYQTAGRPIYYYVFDLLAFHGKSLLAKPLTERRELLDAALAPLADPVRLSEVLHALPADLIAAARQQGLEGLVAKRRKSAYEPGQRTGAWIKVKVNQGQELVIGGYIPGRDSFDSLLAGYYEDGRLLFNAKVRNGFTPHLREEVRRRMKPLETDVCPFDNLPEPKNARRGEALTAEVMKKCRWLKPELVAQVEFTDWTDANHLRHSRFAGLREDKDPREVRREIAR
jgi:bifunctional non-homologous end joining protein LigD